jgi:hypothetical protein
MIWSSKTPQDMPGHALPLSIIIDEFVSKKEPKENYLGCGGLKIIPDRARVTLKLQHSVNL